MTEKTFRKFNATLRGVMFAFNGMMDVYEFRVLAFIFQRTLIFGDHKQWESIPLRHFIDGVYDRSDGTLVTAPVGMNRRTLITSLKHLEGKGFIEVGRSFCEGVPRASRYRIRQREEVDIETVMAYLRRNQPRIYSNLSAKTTKANTTTSVIRRAIARAEYAPTPGADIHQGLGADLHHINSSSERESNREDKLAGEAAREGGGLPKGRVLLIRRPSRD